MPFYSLYLPVAASTKDVSRLISNACLNASSSVLMYEFFLCYFSLITYLWCSLVISLRTQLSRFLLSCLLGDILNATLWITSYLWLNVTKGFVHGELYVLQSCGCFCGTGDIRVVGQNPLFDVCVRC